MQTSGTSCAAASAAGIVRQFGMQKTEKEMAELFKATIGGTSAAHVIYGMQKIGVLCKKVEIKDSSHEKLKYPAMIFIDHPAAGDESHAVAYMGINKGKAELSRKAKVSPLLIDRIEKGNNCRLETKRKIILALGYKLSDKEKIFPED